MFIINKVVSNYLGQPAVIVIGREPIPTLNEAELVMGRCRLTPRLGIFGYRVPGTVHFFSKKSGKQNIKATKMTVISQDPFTSVSMCGSDLLVHPRSRYVLRISSCRQLKI